MEKYEHTMLGFNQAKKFLGHCGYRDDYLNRLESNELVYVANKVHFQTADCRAGACIPHSMEGCHQARQFLLSTGHSVDYVGRLDGHELIYMANQLNTRAPKRFQNV
jgi:hypothetical protein